MATTVVAADLRGQAESSTSAVTWAPIIAGALAASALTLMLMLLGSGLGLTMVSPWSGESVSAETFAVGTAVWLVVMQWLSSLLGGYLTGRLRTKWVGIHTDETFFRDTSHGFLTWALATLLVALVLSTSAATALGVGVQAASNVAAGAAQGATTAAADDDGAADPTAYFVDLLFRPADPAGLATAPADAETATAQASRILVAGATAGEVSAADRTYLGQLVAARTGLSEADATARVNAVLTQAEEAKVAAQAAADKARKAAATFALVSALSLVIGAFIASAAAALGGRLRDDEEAVFLTSRP